MKNVLLILALITVSLSKSIGQDIIQLKSGEKLEVKITKIGKENIEFRPYHSSEDEAIIVLDKFLIDFYKFEFQESNISLLAEKVTNISVEDLYDNKKRYAIKTQPLAAIVLDNYKLSYEQSIAYNKSIEAEMTVDFTSKFSENPILLKGINTTLRYKMFARPASLKMTDTGKNPLSGLYLAPVVSIGFSPSNDGQSSLNSRFNTSNLFLAGMLDIGYQLAIQKTIVDTFVGVGVSLNSEDNILHSNNSHLSIYNGAVRAGFRMGLNFEGK